MTYTNTRFNNFSSYDFSEEKLMPLVCETCLGPNPFIRMQKITLGGTCHISGRPFTIFRWKAGSDARYKKTVISPEVAGYKNVCQVCMLDLKYNLPVQVRDSALGIQEEPLPASDIGREYYINCQKLNSTDNCETSKYNKTPINDLLVTLSKSEPHYKRNQACVCSFFVKGSCNRGIECPYRHEIPLTNELSKQNYHDRYNGTNDPVAKKMLARVANLPKLNQTNDYDFEELFIGNITPLIKYNDLNEVFQTYGKIDTIEILYLRNCALVKYHNHQEAKKAFLNLKRCIIIKGQTLTIRISKSLSNTSNTRNGNL